MQLDDRRYSLSKKEYFLDEKSKSSNPSTHANSHQSHCVLTDVETVPDSKWKAQHPWEQQVPQRTTEPHAPTKVVAYNFSKRPSKIKGK